MERPAYDEVYRRAIVNRLRANPRDPDGLFALAAYLASEQRLRDAIKFLNDLTKVAPHYPGLWQFKARLYQELGETKLALLCKTAASREGETRVIHPNDCGCGAVTAEGYVHNGPVMPIRDEQGRIVRWTLARASASS